MNFEGLLTVDLEDWYHSNYESAGASSSEGLESLVVEHTTILLEIFRRHGSKATFFTLGVVAEEHPELIETIVGEGHEIACHGYGHTQVSGLEPEAFRRDIRQAKRAILDACGVEPKGFRAPSWSISPTRWSTGDPAMWPLAVLAEEGFTYDASLFPFATYLYGVRDAPTVPHQVILPGGGSIYELPASVAEVGGRRWPFGGGFYFRLLPLRLMRLCCRRYLAMHQVPFMFYIHPREITPDQPRLRLGMKERFIHNVNLRSTRRKLDRLLASFRFRRVEDFLRSGGAGRRLYLPADSPVLASAPRAMEGA